MIKTDRSRVIEYRRCPRSRYLGYELRLPEGIGVGGITLARPNLDMLIGSGVHKGLEFMVDPGEAEYAVKMGLDLYNERVREWEDQVGVEAARVEGDFLSQEMEGEEGGGSPRVESYRIAEGRALVEALIRCFWLSPFGRQWMLDNYKINAVERELSIKVADNILFMARPDGELETTTGDLLALSIKTAKVFDNRTSKNYLYDDQGLSELLALQRSGVPAMGVQMLYLLKGRYEQDKIDNAYKTTSGLVRPYYKPGIVSDDDEYRPGWNWIDEEGKNRTLGKGYSRVNIWEPQHLGVKEWIERAAREFPELLDRHLVTPEPQYRSPADIDSWRGQMIYQEWRVSEGAEEVNSYLAEGDIGMAVNCLHKHFPQYRHSCTYPSLCPFIPICHEGMLEPLLEAGVQGIGGFADRRPNHPQEVA